MLKIKTIIMEKFYETPQIEFIEINVEKGFSNSDIVPGGETEGDYDPDAQ